MNSIRYVVKENIQNYYRIHCIAKYEMLADYRDSKLGILWSLLDPIIQIFAYWFAFGLGIRGGQPIDGIPFLHWMLAGIIPWFFLSSALKKGTNSIHKKVNVITKMKFPISILPIIEIYKELFNHLITLLLGYIFIFLNGTNVKLFNFGILYYLFCAIAFSLSFCLVTSVLNMFTRDVKKIINASMRLLMYVTPILWTMDKLPSSLQRLIMLNPLYYIIEGYRSSLFSSNNICSTLNEGIVFWSIVIVLFIIGSLLMYKFKHKFIDYI